MEILQLVGCKSLIRCRSFIDIAFRILVMFLLSLSLHACILLVCLSCVAQCEKNYIVIVALPFFFCGIPHMLSCDILVTSDATNPIIVSDFFKIYSPAHGKQLLPQISLNSVVPSLVGILLPL